MSLSCFKPIATSGHGAGHPATSRTSGILMPLDDQSHPGRAGTRFFINLLAKPSWNLTVFSL